MTLRAYDSYPALARLEDTIFDNLPEADAQEWRARFLSAPKEGADLSLVQWQFLLFVVEEALGRDEAASVRKACGPALAVLRDAAAGKPIDESAANAARSAARRAANAARSAARSAAYAAWSAESAVWSAANAAWSAESAAWSARSAARTGRAWSASWKCYADKLLELMATAPVNAEAGQ